MKKSSERGDVAPATTAAVIGPRCVDKSGAAAYLGNVSIDQIERLIQSGSLPIVRLPAERHRGTGRGVTGTCRRVLIDVKDLDLLVERSKERRGE